MNTQEEPAGRSFSSRIAMWSMRHRKAVGIGWAVAVVVAVAIGQAVPADTNIEETPPGESGDGINLFEERFGVREEAPQEVVVFQHSSLTVDDREYRDVVSTVMRRLRALRFVHEEQLSGIPVLSGMRAVSATTSHYDIGLPREQSPFVAVREGAGDVTFALAEIEDKFGDAEDHVGEVLDSIHASQDEFPEFVILLGGSASQEKQSEDIIQEDFAFALFLNIPITLVILVIAFAAVVAAFVPLALAIASVMIANSILALLSQVYPLHVAYSEITLLMGLATGIDYSLFVISRYRNERRAGKSKEDALETATATSGRAVVFAGITVLIAICGMFLVQNVIFTSLGIAAIVVVAIAVLASITLLPALVAMLGDNLDRLHVPLLGRGEAQHGGVWGVISDRVLARPAVLASTTVIVLILLASPLLILNLGFNGAKGLSDDVEAKKALLALEENFTLGLTSPAVVIVDAGEGRNIFAAEVQTHVTQLASLVAEETATPENRDGTYGAPIETEINNAGDTELVEIPVNADVGEDKGIDAIKHLRNDLVPGAFADSPAEVVVTGQTAANLDFRDDIIRRTPIVLGFVLALVFIVMLLVFRSLVIATKAIVLNLLSVGAAYGVLVLVFQEGWLLEDVLGFEATGIIESWLPLFLFSILFGLSMDYHMFIMGRIKEAHERGLSNDDAISTGVRATAATITNAAAIMVAVAVIFAFTRNIGLKQFGFGLAVAIVIDATVIRSILLPASMKLLGERNWYLPRWLEWLPRVRMAE